MKKHIAWTTIALLAGIGTHIGTASADTGREFVNGPRAALSSTLPFTDAVRVGDTLYVSGTLGLDPKTGRAVEGVEAEAHAAMENVKAAVERAGFTMDDVVSVQVYCTDLTLYDAFNGVYRGYFAHGFPARAFIGVKELLRGAHFEVMSVAVRAQAAH